MLAPWKKSYDQPRQHIKKQRHYFANKGPSIQSCGFSSSHVCMWDLEYKEGWALKNWCFQAVVLEKSLESPLACKEIKQINPKGNQSWIFIGRADGSWTSNTLATDWKRPWCWERLRNRGRQRMRQLEGIINSMDVSLSKLWVIVKDRRAGVQQTQLSDWTTGRLSGFLTSTI